MQHAPHRAQVGLVALLWLVAAGQASAAELRSAPPDEQVRVPARACTALRAADGFQLLDAQALPAAGEAPARCRVRLGLARAIHVELNLPERWNRRLYMFGNGGYAGEPMESEDRLDTRLRMLRQGFAVLDTDTGHDTATEPLASFAADHDKLVDYGHRSLHLSVLAGRALVRQYFAAEPARSYFQSCSNGGRQALVLAQRYPADFDGIVATAPALDFVGTVLAFTRITQALSAAPIPPSKLELLSRHVNARCDAVDGLVDGLIDDPRRCAFRPAQHLPVCTKGHDEPGCFTPAQLHALETIYADLTDVDGRRLFPGWPPGAEIADAAGRSNWMPWLVAAPGEPTIARLFAESFLRYIAEPPFAADFRVEDFRFSTAELARLQPGRDLIDATATDLTAFRDRGGKLLVSFGWADGVLNARMGTEYYERVLQRMGPQTPEFFRLFMVPGMFHCGSGVGPDRYDALGATVAWVERGVAPDSLHAERVEGGRTVRSRPLCPYPQVAHYRGIGSIDEASSFVCSVSPSRPVASH